MNSQLLVDVEPKNGMATIALLEDGQLVEYRTQRQDASFVVGDIYVGVVHRVMQNHNAAFVDIGHVKEGFLHYKDLGGNFTQMSTQLRKYLRATKGKGLPPDGLSYFASPSTRGGRTGQKGETPPEAAPQRLARDGKITEHLKQGDLVMVQVEREAFASKGPSLTTEISIAGRNMVLLPMGRDRVMVSSKIVEREEISRLKQMVRGLLPPGYGVIIRTAARGQEEEALRSELQNLVERWSNCLEALGRARTYPQLLLGEITSASAILRDNLNASYSSIQLNHRGLYDEVRDYLRQIAPGNEDIVKLYSSSRVPLFEHFDVSKQVRRLMGQTVYFHKGSYLIIDHPEAFHVIDVNSGSGSKKAETPEETAFEVNLAACDEIARQLRLRDMGGIIVIDFIDMAMAEHRRAILERMRELMRTDRVTHKILPLSDFGLMQITRQRLRPEQSVDTSERCPCCQGTGKVGNTQQLEDIIERQFALLAERKLFPNLELRVHPFLAAYYTQGWPRSRRYKLSKAHRCKLRVTPQQGYTLLQYAFFNPKGEQITLD